MSELNENELSYHRAVYLAGLIHKSREKEPLTEEEQRDLDNWLNSSTANQTFFASQLHRQQLAEELKILLSYNEDKAVSAVFKTIEKLPAVIIPLWKMIVQRSLVAALLLLLAGVTWRFFVRRSLSGREGTPAIAAGTIPPGGYQAVLTLEDGRQLKLDSTHSGLLVTQGAARVEQGKDGLVYTKEGDGMAVYNTITVGRGGMYHVVLADRSEVWLNAASSITYPTAFTGNKREVTIIGEAYFNVAKDATKPFGVTAQGMKVEVLGTEFDVMAYPDEDAVRTTLISGSVRASATNRVAPPKQLLLQPGEQAVLADRSGVLRTEKPDPEAVTDWRRGEFLCHQTPLAAIMRQVGRWYDVTIQYRGSVANVDFSGQLSRKQRVEDLLDILSDTRKVHFEIRESKTIVVIPGPK